MNDFSEYWAVIESYVTAIQNAFEAKAQGRVELGAHTESETAEISAASRGANTNRRVGQIGVIPIYGLLMQRSSWLLDWLGGTSMEDFNRDLDTFLDDSDVSKIVLDVDSGGGSVFGIEETAKKILAARERKPIYAVANSTMASAAYWLAASASKIFATPGAETGSIGTLAIHVDQSGSDTMLGVRRTIIKQGRAKAYGNVFEPLTAEARDEIQGHVNRYYDMFVRSVAKGRGVTPNQVEKNYGQGRVFGPEEAKELGMIDGIATLDELLGSLQSKKGARGAGARAETESATDVAIQLATIWDASKEPYVMIDEVRGDRESQPGKSSVSISKAIALTLELSNNENAEPEESTEEEQQPSGRDAGLLRRRLRLATIK